MSRYIDADAVKEYILTNGFYCDTEADKRYSAELIDKIFPTANVVEVKHGPWIAYGLEDGFAIERYICSECGYDVGVRTTTYCPNCGSQMDLDGDTE